MPLLKSGLQAVANWARGLKRIIRDEANKAAKQVATETYDYLIENTHVDTSKALSNWQVGIDSVPTDVIEAHVKGTKGSTQAESEKIAKGIAHAKIKKKSKKKVVYIVNNIPQKHAQNAQIPGLIASAEALAAAEAEKVKINVPNV